MLKREWLVATLASLTLGGAGNAQHANGESRETWTFDTHTPGPCSPTGAAHGGCDPGQRIPIRVVTVATGLVRPWHLTFLPGRTDMLVTELPGALRIVRNGVLDPAPIADWPVDSIPARSLNAHRNTQGLAWHPAPNASILRIEPAE